MNGPSDADLLQAVRQGDSHALGTLLERHAPAVYRFGLKLCGNPEDAQDVVQDTLLAAARSLNDFRGDASLTTWLYTVARNACHRRARGAPAATVALESLPDAAAPLASASSSPEIAADRNTLAQALDAELARLSATDREILVLRDVEGLGASQVADVLGISVSAVKSRLHRARAALRARMEPYFPENERPSSLPVQSTCPEIVSVFSRYLEDEIGPAECEAMQDHVEQCPRCNAACNSLRRSLAACRAIPATPIPAGTQATIRQALGALLQGSPRTE